MPRDSGPGSEAPRRRPRRHRSRRRAQADLARARPRGGRGDYVIVHVGYAISRLDPEEARKTLALFAAIDARSRSAGVKYVDEFRDGELARALAAAIERAVEPGRRYNLMEFCGGHTHAISRYGVTDLLPKAVHDGARPRLPGVRAADRADRQRDRARARARRDRVHLCGHDARAGVQPHEPDEGEGARAPTSGWSTRRPTRCASRARTRRRGRGLLRHRLRDDHAADGGRDPARPSARRSPTSPCSATTC